MTHAPTCPEAEVSLDAAGIFLTHGRGSDVMQPMAIPSVGACESSPEQSEISRSTMSLLGQIQ
jgi:hypothetical protein